MDKICLTNYGAIFIFLSLGISPKVFAVERPCFPVRLGESTITCLTQGIGSISAESRAQAVEAKIKKLAETLSYDPQKITTNEAEGAYKISSGELRILTVAPHDVEPNLGLSVQQAAEKIGQDLRDAIVHYRVARSPDALLAGAGYAFLATLLLLVALFLVQKLSRYFDSKIESMANAYSARLKFRSYQLVTPHRSQRILEAVLSGVRIVITVTIFYIYIPLLLSFFPDTARWAPQIIDTF